MQVVLIIYVPLLIYYAYANSTFCCGILKPRTWLRKPVWACFFYCSVLLIPVGILKNYFFTAGTLLIYVVFFFSVLLFFQGKLRQKIICFLYFSLTLCFIESTSGSLIILVLYFKNSVMQITPPLHTNQITDLLLTPLLEIPIGIYFYYKVTPLLRHFLLFFRTRTCLMFGLPIIIPVFAQALIYLQNQSPDFPTRMLLYWLVCAICYPVFFIGLKDLDVQEKNRAWQEKQLQISKKQLEFSQKLEREYQNSRKWNHDIDNHLLSLSYLIEIKNYQEAISYCSSILQNDANNDMKQDMSTGGDHET